MPLRAKQLLLIFGERLFLFGIKVLFCLELIADEWKAEAN